MYTFLDECPACKTPEARAEFAFTNGCAASRYEPGEGAAVSEIFCCHCWERLDEFDDVMNACLEAALAELEAEKYPDI